MPRSRRSPARCALARPANAPHPVLQQALCFALNYLPDAEPAEGRRLSTAGSAKCSGATSRRIGAMNRALRDLPAGRRLRIGYVSADFRNHVVSFFMEPVLAKHDHARFEIFCYYTHHQKDRVTDGLRPLADHWIDCEELSDAELAARIRADRIDILVDLGGHTADNRLLVFAEKPAPVQATYLGYPNTTGMETIDYHITDAFADPPGRPPLEPIRRAAASLLPAPRCACVAFARRLPGITFGCFNHFAKVSSEFLEPWRRC